VLLFVGAAVPLRFLFRRSLLDFLRERRQVEREHPAARALDVAADAHQRVSLVEEVILEGDDDGLARLVPRTPRGCRALLLLDERAIFSTLTLSSAASTSSSTKKGDDL
jgi:hypothetical protein